MSSNLASAELIRELKAKDAELEMGKRRERDLKRELARAAGLGFVALGGAGSEGEGRTDLNRTYGELKGADGEDGDEVRKLVEGLMVLKRERSKLQVSDRPHPFQPLRRHRS